MFILSGIDTWKDLPVFLVRDYLFSRNGVCPYAEQDEKKVIQMIEKVMNLNKKKDDYEDGKDKSKVKKKRTNRHLSVDGNTVISIGSLEKYFLKNMNNSHRGVIKFLKPIAFAFPN